MSSAKTVFDTDMIARTITASPRVLYHLSDLLKWPDACVFVCEGEKDADRVASLDHCATAVACGKWTDDCVQALTGRDVLILGDADKPGRKKALAAATAMYGTASTIRIVRLPGLTGEPKSKDVSDWLDFDLSRGAKLADICFEAPLWTPVCTQNLVRLI
jgi:DNA primase